MEQMTKIAAGKYVHKGVFIYRDYEQDAGYYGAWVTNKKNVSGMTKKDCIRKLSNIECSDEQHQEAVETAVKEHREETENNIETSGSKCGRPRL